MKKIIYLILITLGGDVLAQETSVKLPISYLTYNTWERLGQYGISPDGKYIFYTKGVPLIGHDSLVLSSFNGEFKRKFKCYSSDEQIFSSDGQRLLFGKSKDSVAIVDLKSNDDTVLACSGDFTQINNMKIPMLLYKNGQHVYLLNLQNNSVSIFKNVTSYKVSTGDKCVVLQRGTKLFWVDLPTRIQLKLPDSAISEWKIEPHAKGILYIVRNKDCDKIKYFNYISRNVREISSGVLTQGRELGGYFDFSPNGKYVFFEVGDKDIFMTRCTHGPIADVEIKSYKSTHPFVFKPNRTLFVKSLISNEKPKVLFSGPIGQPINSVLRVGDEHCMIKTTVNDDESHWNFRPKFFVLSIKTGGVKDFIPASQIPKFNLCVMSPLGKVHCLVRRN